MLFDARLQQSLEPQRIIWVAGRGLWELLRPRFWSVKWHGCAVCKDDESHPATPTPSLTKSCFQPPSRPTTCSTAAVVVKNLSCSCSYVLYPHHFDILHHFAAPQLPFYLSSEPVD
jgi:hypothetical protein